MIGQCAGSRTSTGLSLIYMGALSGQCNINGTCTIAIGRGAGIGDTNGHANVYIGNHAGGQICGGTSVQHCNWICCWYKIFGMQNIFPVVISWCLHLMVINIALGRRIW